MLSYSLKKIMKHNETSTRQPRIILGTMVLALLLGLAGVGCDNSNGIEEDAEQVGETVGEAAEDAVDAVEETAEDAADAVEDAAEDVKDAVDQ